MATRLVSIGAVIGRNVQELRGKHGWTQEEAARQLRDRGLSWTRAQLAFLEEGRRAELPLGELLVLTLTLGVRPACLLRGEGIARLTKLATLPLRDVRELIGQEGNVPVGADGISIAPDSEGKDRLVGQQRIAPSIAEASAARRLGVEPVRVYRLGRLLWHGRGLDAERDRRLGRRAEAGASRAAYRGHVTRELLAELRKALETLNAGYHGQESDEFLQRIADSARPEPEAKA